MRCIHLLSGCCTLITTCFDHFELRKGEALVQLFDPGDELSGEIHPGMLLLDEEAIMLAAILQSHRNPTVASMPAMQYLSCLLHINISITQTRTHQYFLRLL